MSFDYSKLLGRIKERGYTQETLAKHIAMSESTLSQKLNNKTPFKQRDIREISDALEISSNDIGAYFFYIEGSENRT